MLEVIHGTTEKPVSTKQLVDLLKDKLPDSVDGLIYIGYPILGTVDGGVSLDVVLVSNLHGIIIFDLFEGPNMVNHSEERDRVFLNTQSRLIQYPSLMKGRNLGVNLEVLSYAPSAKAKSNDDPKDSFYDSEELIERINSLSDESNTNYFRALTSVIQTVTKLAKSRQRAEPKNPSSRGSKLKKLEDSIANLDSKQNRAVIETVNGPQRIRGLAGSGKTIILALKAAYLHARYPEWNILVTFNTRSLKEQFTDLITKFTIEQMGQEPNWDKLKIMHSWGSSSSSGVYYDFCLDNGITFYDYKAAISKFGRSYAFGNMCNDAIRTMRENEKKAVEKYDVVLIDEAQDFTAPFLRLCFMSLKEPKRLIWAYDELQNLNINTIRSPQELFGRDLSNEVDGPKGDIILERCYRNSRPILVTAHGLGFGTERTEGLVQMFGEPNLWLDIGYEKESGELAGGKEVVLERTPESSPKFLEDHSDINDLIIFKSFKKKEEQANWIVDSIIEDLKKQELTHKDIIIINLNPLTTEIETAAMRAKLFEKGINTHVAGVTTSADKFLVTDSVAFTGIYRAKGNEAPMVYVINADYAYSGPELIKKRNMLFSAITRSKAWVRVTGLGDSMDKLMEEYLRIKNNNFKLSFVYPTTAEMEKMRVINRDLTITEVKKIAKTEINVSQLVLDLKEGTIRKEDIANLPELLKLIHEDKHEDEE